MGDDGFYGEAGSKLNSIPTAKSWRFTDILSNIKWDQVTSVQ